MNEPMDNADLPSQPLVWLVDTATSPLSEAEPFFASLAKVTRHRWGKDLPAVPPFPDAVFFTADLGEIDGLPGLEQLRRHLPDTPLLAVARVRSLAQAVDLFRRGVADYLSLPLDLAEVQERLAVAITTANSQLAAVTVEFEALDADPGDWRLSLSQVEESPATPPLAGEAGEEAEPVEETQPVEAGSR